MARSREGGGGEERAAASQASSPVGDSEVALARLESARDERPRLAGMVGVVGPLAGVVVRTEAKRKVGAKGHPDRDEILEVDARRDSALESGDHALADARQIAQPTLADAQLTSTKSHSGPEKHQVGHGPRVVAQFLAPPRIERAFLAQSFLDQPIGSRTLVRHRAMIVNATYRRLLRDLRVSYRTRAWMVVRERMGSGAARDGAVAGAATIRPTQHSPSEGSPS